MEINVNFVFFEELRDKPETDGDVMRIVVLRGKNADVSLDAETIGFLPLE